MRCPFCGHDDTQVKDSLSEGQFSDPAQTALPEVADVSTFERAWLRGLSHRQEEQPPQTVQAEKLDVRSPTRCASGWSGNERIGA
jgi:hypothetical protein